MITPPNPADSHPTDSRRAESFVEFSKTANLAHPATDSCTLWYRYTFLDDRAVDAAGPSRDVVEVIGQY